ncbi:hypothetical protein GCM10009681_50510 [Luedemannella helvata]|uniref:Uncharacterized protein n=2 Tax=Luedemannella helvata TaxID=349315 RepID=A0ABN2L2K7_9ACTN
MRAPALSAPALTVPAGVPPRAAGRLAAALRSGDGSPSGVALAAGFALTAAIALAVAARAPLATTVLGLIAFGALHNVLELRYVAGRFAGVLRGRLLVVLLALVTGILVCRLAAARTPEIVLAYALLGVGVAYAVTRPWWRLAALGGLGGALAASLAFPAYHFVILTHLHNVVPLFFLWEWSRRLTRGRTAFRVAQVGWVLGIPALILLGVADGLVVNQLADGGAGTVTAFAGTPAKLAAPFVPPGLQPDLVVGLRFLVVFAFLQTMHYAVWVGFLPRAAPDAAAAFEARVPWLAGWRAWALGAAAAAPLAVLFAVDYTQGRVMYSAFASYHAYLEFPVLLALLFRPRAPDSVR